MVPGQVQVFFQETGQRQERGIGLAQGRGGLRRRDGGGPVCGVARQQGQPGRGGAVGWAGVDVVAEHREVARKPLIQMGLRMGSTDRRKGGEQDAAGLDGFRVVVVEEQGLVQLAGEGAQGLGPLGALLLSLRLPLRRRHGNRAGP